MKKVTLGSLFLLVFFVSVAFAGSPNLKGEWSGSGRAIYPDGNVVQLEVMGVIETQVFDLVSGYFEFTLETDLENELQVDFTGHIAKNKRLKGVMSAGDDGIGIVDAKWSGKKIEGVALDLFDFSTTYFKVRRVR